VCPPATQTYTLRVVGNDNSEQFRQVTVNVAGSGFPTPTPIPPPMQGAPTIWSFSPDRTSIGLGQCVNFSYNTANATNVALFRNGYQVTGGGPSGSLQDCPPNIGIMEYMLTAYGGGGSISQKVTVEVLSRGPR
jgi:hypothetical protein